MVTPFIAYGLPSYGGPFAIWRTRGSMEFQEKPNKINDRARAAFPRPKSGNGKT
jgi:hypothetical protein